MHAAPESAARPDETARGPWTGLSDAEALARLTRDGPNELPRPPPPSRSRQLAAQLVHFFALMLWAAGALAIVGGMPELGVAIFFVVVVNGVFAFAQERRAERAAEALRDLLPRRATVRREGAARAVDARCLVREDVVLLAAGDRVAADLRLVEAHALAIDASTMTGESVAVRPDAGDLAFAGTFVVEGEATGIVEKTGVDTSLGRMAALTRAAPHPRTLLARELARLVHTIAILAVSIGAAFFVVGTLFGLPLRSGFLFAIGVMVALVPEGLLPTVTLSLALGAQRMAHRKALVRRLESVETLGSTTFICTDKTGTLTQNEMSVVEAWTPEGTAAIRGVGYDPAADVDVSEAARSALIELSRAAMRCSTGRGVLREGAWRAQGDPMEAALDVLARRVGAGDEAEAGGAPLATARFPFDARRRRMSVLVDGVLYVKGAPDSVLPRCRSDLRPAEDAVAAMSARGLRVLAVARRRVRGLDRGTSADEAESDLELLGIVGLEDPPRPSAPAAVAACRRAGIRVAMVTGDHAGTASAIAREIGLARPGAPIVEGKDLPDADAELGALVDRDGAIVCRVSPEDKLRIARALQARGHVLAMTGDGVNDGPALEQADIGIAMGRSGTDVARDASDLVLLDDDFATIVLAIEQGRATFTNLRRSLTYHLTDNVAELAPFIVWALSAGRVPLALGVLQILFLDLLTDQLPALALAAEPPDPNALDTPPLTGHLVDRALLIRALGVLGPTEAIVALAAFGVALAELGSSFGVAPEASVLRAASGAAFTAVVVGQCANALGLRARGTAPNRGLVAAIAFAIALLLVSLFAPPLARLLGQAPPPWMAALVALVAAPATLTAGAVHARWRRARAASHEAGVRGPTPRMHRSSARRA